MLTAANVLAGPILRRVEHDLVSVWIALTVPAEVNLDIYHGAGPAGGLGPKIGQKIDANRNRRDFHTAAAGKGLHISVSVWEPSSVAGLDWGGLYSYDVRIKPDDGSGEVGLKDLRLLADGVIHAHDTDHPHLALGYQQDWLPSFALPPANIADLKLIQGSCRGTNGLGRDAMPAIDDLLRNVLTDPKQRPHQMHLTGDQIYADEGAPELVEIIDNLTGELLGGVAGKTCETIRIDFPAVTADQKTGVAAEPADQWDVPIDVAHLPPGRRAHLTIDVAHFSSDHSDSHAIGFGEYCGTYLTGWCNVPWTWNPKKLMSDAKARFSAYVAAVKPLHGSARGPNAFKSPHPGVDDPLKTADEMIRNYAGWKLVPDAYCKIDSNLTRDDIARAWGRADAADARYFDFWNDFMLLNSTDEEPLPLARPPLSAAPGDQASQRMNRLARALTPAWFAGNKYFGVTYDVDTLKIKGTDVYNRIHRLDWCYQDLPKIRRVLANIPTYMVFDDHEITDDWNITPAWVKKTRGNAMGRGVVRNGLAAFFLFQYWGNDPRACRDGVPNEVLTHIEQLFANVDQEPGPDPTAAAWLEKTFDLVLPSGTQQERMLWHYRYDGPQFEVLALDSRTWRGFENDANDLLLEPFSEDDSATLLTAEAVQMQIPELPPAGINPNGACIVIAAAPFMGFPPVESIAQPLVNLAETIKRVSESPFTRWKNSLLFGRVAHDPETWGYRPALFEAMLARLSSRNRVIFFSGDVHYSFAGHLNYWKLDVNGNPTAATKFVQLTASSMRAQQPTVSSIMALDLLQQFGGITSTQSREGWHRRPGDTIDDAPIKPGFLPFNAHVKKVLLDDPILVSPDGLPKGTQYLRKPEWVWEMGLDGDVRPDTDRFATNPPPSFSNASHVEQVQSVARRHAWETRYSMPRRWHWWTNYTVVSFTADASSIVYRVFSFDPDGLEPAAQPFMTTNIDFTVKPQAPPELVEKV